MPQDDFFKKEEKIEEKPIENVVPEKIKVGEKEYTQEELSRVVGLGELGVELESKWNTPLQKLYPEYTKATQEREDLRKYKEEQERLATEAKAKKGEELTPEETKKQALVQADALGLIHSGNVNQFIAQFLQARDLIEDTEAAVSEAQEKYGIKTNIQSVVDYMNQPENPKNPQKAIKDMFEEEIDTWKEQQLTKVKVNGMQTLDSSNAGSKQPEIPKLTNIDSLRDAMRSRFNRS